MGYTALSIAVLSVMGWSRMVRMAQLPKPSTWSLGPVASLLVRCAFVLTVATSANLARALSGGAGPAPLPPDSPWAGVGSLSVNGQLFTGTLIAPGYVLTAAHVVAGAQPGSVVFRVGGGQVFSSPASDILVNPAYTGSTFGNTPGDPSRHGDLAIVKLAKEAPTFLPHYKLHASPLLWQVVQLVSFGRSIGLATTGANVVDTVFNDPSGVAQTYMFDFDGPDLSSNRIGSNLNANGTLGSGREASLVGGDSGSGAFVEVNGQWQLAGINTFAITFAAGPTTQGAFGTGGGGVVLAGQLAWIRSVLSPTSKPEPASAAMGSSDPLPWDSSGGGQRPPASWRSAPTTNSVLVTK